ncbi:fluoroquinolone export ABC transporter permease subunit [Flindersiella endophytica]
MSAATAGRLGALLVVESCTLWRQRVPAAVLGLAGFWSVVLLLLPVPVARIAAPYLLFLEIMTVGTLFVGAQVITDRSTGATAALGVSPIRSGEYVAAKLVPLGVITTVSAVPVLLAGRHLERLGDGLLTAALCGLLLLAVAVEIAGRKAEFVSFMVALAVPMVVLFAVPLAVSIGLLAGPLWYAVPTTGALAVLRGTEPYPAGWMLGYLALATAATTAYVAGSLRRRSVTVPGRVVARVRPLPARPRWLVFPRADLRNVTRDSMLAMVALSPLLLALALRFGYPPLAGWLRGRGLELAPYEPVLVILAVVVHVPVAFGMSGALLVLDDLEDQALAVVRTSPLGIRRFLVYRLTAVTVLSAAGLAVAAPLSGLVPAAGLWTLPIAALLGPLMMLAMLAVARSRVQGVTAGKLLALPMYLPIAAWWLGGPLDWLLAPLPAYWIVRYWAGGHAIALPAGLVCLAAWLVPLGRRVLRTFDET